MRKNFNKQNNYKNNKSPQFSDEQIRQNNNKKMNNILRSPLSEQKLTDVQTSQQDSNKIIQQRPQSVEKKNNYHKQHYQNKNHYQSDLRKGQYHKKDYYNNTRNQSQKYKNNLQEYKKKGNHPLLDQSRQLTTRFQKPSSQYVRIFDNNSNKRKNDHIDSYKNDNVSINRYNKREQRRFVDNKNYQGQREDKAYSQNSYHKDINNNNNININPLNTQPTNQIYLKQRYLQILQQIQLLDYKQINKSKQSLLKQFISIISQHIQFQQKYFPLGKDQVGKMLIKNGVFHQMWSKIMLRLVQLSNRQQLRYKYYHKYLNIIQKSISSFQSTFNPIPQSQSDQDCLQYAQQAYRNYISNQYHHNHNNNNNNNNQMRDQCMMLFQNIKKQIIKQKQHNKIQNELSNDIKKRIQQYKEKRQYNYNIKQADIIDRIQESINNNNNNNQNNDNQNNDIDDQNSQNNSHNSSFVILNNIQLSSYQSKNLQKNIKPSTLQLLFQQCISNQKRLTCEMACTFLNISKLYRLSQIQIIQIKQMHFTQKQQISILSAYTAQYCPNTFMMKIQPKLKTLISVYKFISLIELIRLEKIYGKFDGVVVYSDYLNMEKFLLNIKENYVIKIGEQNDRNHNGNNNNNMNNNNNSKNKR